jgi:D-aminopeptidase
MMKVFSFSVLMFVLASPVMANQQVASTPAAAGESPDEARPRVRDLGITPGVLSPGLWNAITDVAGVRVGHVTLIEGDAIRTGVTAVLPHADNVYQNKVPAGFVAANAFGKFAGSTQIVELGEIETPIVLTNTLSVPEGAAGVVEWTLRQPGNETARSVNAVVGETNDGFLNDIRARKVTAGMVGQAIDRAESGPVTEGSVGAGTGTVSFGWKGGIGTSSRVLPESLGGYTLGVLVQTNYGGILSVDGVPVGEALGQYYLKNVVDSGDADGSVIMVVATDAPLSDRNLERLARRALMAIARTGSPATNGSGDYAVAFSTADSVRRSPARRGGVSTLEQLPNDRMSPLFQAAVEASEEAILNALFKATSVTGHRGTVEAIDVEAVKRVLSDHGR